MSITLTALGTTLQVSILDDNFTTIQDLFRSGILRTDITGQFDRYAIMRYTGGRLVSATSFGNGWLNNDNWTDGKVDMTFRYGTDKSVRGYYDSNVTSRTAMELLGKPGPSFYYQFQEDGISDATVAATGAAGWPPTGYPPTRYPRNLCFSPWLTVPGASLKTWVEEPCVARVSASARGSLNHTTLGLEGFSDTRFYHVSFIDKNVNQPRFHSYRFALVADTNPVLYSDEFANTNPRVVDPATGVQAPYCSWKVIKEHGFHAGQRQEFKLMGEVALKGGRYYNFSYKFRHGGIVGFVAYDPAGPGTTEWVDGGYLSWGKYQAATNNPTLDATWSADIQALYVQWLAASNAIPIGNFCEVMLWEQAAIHVEFLYGRDAAYQTDSTAAEFSTKPT